jgi:hypothetical protein
MDDLIPFLTARYAERATRLEEILSNQDSFGEEMQGGWELWGDFGHLVGEVVDFEAMLADIAAKRKILALHDGLHECVDNQPSWGTVTVFERYCPTVRLLAQPFARHPDFREEWTASSEGTRGGGSG